ncbi:hypothetical protein [Prosthecobacter sp.]|uniref:hypothetical protein n=1 Tax=Prosthecobacter sp. TaxID=1965333 RepID=UPI001D62D7E1|nr:hypothetical protein [Prosthecobacter sp.]MCB1279669.1 hypothetical protein [Prosthecobacter sp.]
MAQLEWPLFVFREDGVLQLCETLEDARREFEGVDVEARVFEFYDFSGCPVKPVFLQLNEHSSFLGLIHTVSSAVFEFRRDPDLETDPIDVAVLETAILEKNDRFEGLIQVRKHLENRGCSMELSRLRQETEAAEQVSGGGGG